MLIEQDTFAVSNDISIHNRQLNEKYLLMILVNYLKNSLIAIEDANENITGLRLAEIYIKYSWSALILLKRHI